MSDRKKSSKLEKQRRTKARDVVPTLDLKKLVDLPPWEWPREAPRTILRLLRDRLEPEADRELAVTLVGDLCEQTEDTFKACLQILACPEAWISTALFEKAKATLHDLWKLPDLPKSLRRRILEGAIRAPQDWHSEAIRMAFLADDTEWKLTAVFAMNHVGGFENEILEALEHPDPEIHLWAVMAAGAWELEKAWPHVRAILRKAHQDKDLLLAAIEAAPALAPLEACEILGSYLDSKDEDISDAAMEAMSIADGDGFGEDLDEDEWEDRFFGEDGGT